jgi:hypothetical protein
MPKKLARLASIIIAVWAGIAAWIIVPEVRARLGLKVIEGPNVTGTWRSNTSGKVYGLIQHQHQVEVYPYQTGSAGPLVGTGIIAGKDLILKLAIEITDGQRADRRFAILNLALSPDGESLFGTFSGADPREQGVVSFRRLAAG